VLRLRLTDAERDLAATLMAQGKFAEAVRELPALQEPVSSSAAMARRACRTWARSARPRGRPWCARRSGR
jgi:hypothetical protein